LQAFTNLTLSDSLLRHRKLDWLSTKLVDGGTPRS